MNGRNKIILLSGMLSLSCTSAHAQSTGDKTSLAQAAPERALEEIIVTARKRAETAQTTPVVITALSQEQLERYNVNDMTKIAEMTPQLMISSGSNGNGGTINLRGIGSSSTSSGFDQAVSINVDGIQYSRATVLHQGYFDVGRVEVLKGPQSLFFGKSSSAGVISLTTANPGSETEFKVKLGNEFEAHEHWGEAVWSSPLSEAVGVRLAVRFSEDKGYIKNTATAAADFGNGSPIPAPDGRWPDDKQTMARLTLTASPINNLEMNFKFNFAKSDGGGYSPGTVLISCPGGAGLFGVAAPGFSQVNPSQRCGRSYTVAQNPVAPSVAAAEPTFDKKGGSLFSDYDAYSTSLNLNYQMNNLMLTSVSGWYHFEDQYLGDYDFSATPLISGYESPDERAWSEELRLASSFDSPVNFLVGSYYQHRDFSFTSNSRVAPLPADPFTGRYVTWARDSTTAGKAWSFFAQASWKPIDTVEISAGARYSDERKDSMSVNRYIHPFAALLGINLRPAGLPLTAQTHDTNTSPELTVSWKPSHDMMVYGSLKKGFKSGGYSNSAILSAVTTAADATFRPETAKGFEIGFKSAWLADTLQFNLAAYDYKFDDLQVNFFDAANINFVTQNAASATTKGAEAEMRWLPPVDGLDIHANASYNQAKYGRFLSFCYAGQSYEDGCNLNASGAVVAAPGNHQDLSQTKRPLAPEVTLSLGTLYRFHLGAGWMMSLSYDASYSDTYLLNSLGRQIYQPSYVLSNASVSFFPANERWQIAFIGRNLSNEFVAYDAGDSPGTGGGTGQTRAATVLADQLGVAGRGRELTLQVSAKF